MKGIARDVYRIENPVKNFTSHQRIKTVFKELKSVQRKIGKTV